jgi:hypothetical protein
MYAALAMAIDVLLPSGPMEPWASGTCSIFEATTPRLMYLHAYASPMPSPVTVARLASERSGSIFSGGISHPQDDELKFRELYRMLLLLRPTVPGRCHR